jgi:hypothetical protein
MKTLLIIIATSASIWIAVWLLNISTLNNNQKHEQQ